MGRRMGARTARADILILISAFGIDDINILKVGVHGKLGQRIILV